jgi:hypothetical protein
MECHCVCAGAVAGRQPLRETFLGRFMFSRAAAVCHSVELGGIFIPSSTVLQLYLPMLALYHTEQAAPQQAVIGGAAIHVGASPSLQQLTVAIRLSTREAVNASKHMERQNVVVQGE